MADEQVIVEIKVETEDITKAVKKVDSLTDSIEELGNLISSARKQNKEFKKQQQELNQEYDNGKISTQQYEKGINTLNTKIKSNNVLIAKTSNELSIQKRERSANIKLVNTEVGTLRQLEAQASVLNLAISKQTKGTKEGREEYERLEKELGLVNQAVNEQRQAFKDNTKNIGNYTESINKANFNTAEIADNMEQVGGASGNAVGGIKSMGASFKALLANPVVLVLSLIVGALTALFSAFKKSANGSKLLEKAGAALSGLFMVITTVADTLAGALISLWEDPKQAVLDLWEIIKVNVVQRFEGLLNLFSSVGDALSALWNGDLPALEDAALRAGQAMTQIATGLTPEQLGEVAGAIGDVFTQAQNLANAMIALENAQEAQRISARGLERDIAILNAEFEALSELAGDDTQHLQDMNKAAIEAAAVAVELAKKEEQLAQQKLNIINQEVAIRRSAGEDIRDLLDEQIAAEVLLIETKSKSAIQQQKILIEQRKIERDIFEQNLDILLDVGDKIKTEQEKQINNESFSLEKRKQLLEASKVALSANFAEIKKEYELYGVTAEQINEVINQSDAKQTNEKLKALGLNEIANNRLREIILERKQVELDFADIQIELSKEEIDRKKEATATINDLENEKSQFLIEKEIEKLENIEGSDAKRLELAKTLNEQLIKFEEDKLNISLLNENLTAEERKALTLETELEILKIKENAFSEESILNEERQAELVEKLRDNFAEISEITAEFAGEEFAIFGGIAESIALAFEDGKISTETALQGLSIATDAVFSSINAKREQELVNLEEQKEKELELAGDNESAKAAIEKKFDAEQKKIKLKQFNADKAAALLQIGINTALAITKGFAQLGPVAGIPAAIALGIVGGIQAGIVAVKQPPAFGSGTSDIVGIGGSHASGNDVTVVGYDKSGKSQIFGRVEKGEAMPVIRKSAVNDYHVAKMNGNIRSSNKTFAEGTGDITDSQQAQNNIDTKGLISAIENINVNVKVEDITDAIGNKANIEDNSVV